MTATILGGPAATISFRWCRARPYQWRAGTDIADYGDKAVSVRVTLNGSIGVVVKVGGVAEDTIKNIENIYGGIAADAPDRRCPTPTS